MIELLKTITGYVDEIVIIDGMSNDGTYEACLNFPVRIIQLLPKGPDADREYCIKQFFINNIIC
jgi:glycosyltransferase involved in cell wall biosynthesis